MRIVWLIGALILALELTYIGTRHRTPTADELYGCSHQQTDIASGECK